MQNCTSRTKIYLYFTWIFRKRKDDIPMQNISIDTLYALLDRFDTLKNLLAKYGTFLIIAAAIFALLNCFFGYALRKVWSVLLGFAIGASGGMLLASYTEQSRNMTLGVTLGLGFIFGLLALLLYRIGTFFLIIGFLGFSLFKLLNPQDLIMLLFLGAIAFVVALIGVPFERITVTLITSVCGALTAVTLAYDLQQTEYDLVMWIIVLVLAALGMIFQFKPWKDRGYEEEDEEEENYRRSRKQHRRSRTPSRSTVSRTSGKRKKKKASRSSSGHSSSRGGSSSRRTKVSQNTMYDFRFVPEEPDDAEDEDDEELLERPARRSPRPEQTPVPGPAETTSPAAGDTRPIPDPRSVSAEPDLSEIRQQISAEVQEIYRDSQEHTDDF